MAKRPNILLLTTDQQRYDSLGFTGNPIVRTPNIDSLAASGLSFTNAFSPCPLCCPVRQTLLTGVMPGVHGGHWNYGSTSRIKGLKPNEYPTWTQALKDAGYATGYVGKWHVDPVADPTDFGYDVYEQQQHTPRQYRGVKHPVAERVSDSEPLAGFPPGMYDRRRTAESPTHGMAAATVALIEKFAAGEAPWHIRLDYSQPHLPCIPTEPFASMYDPANIPEWGNFRDEFADKPYIQRKQLENWNLQDWGWGEWAQYLSGYFGIISQYDHAYGMILETLDRLGLFEDTLIVYSTDHGDAAGSHRMMDKHYVMYEEEVRVPLVMRWDGMIAPGTVSDAFVGNYLDLGPTILDVAGLPIPECYQGVSLLPQMRSDKLEPTGEKNAALATNADDRDLIWSEYNGQQFGLFTQRMVRDRRYKYVWNATDVDEFYDLEEDPWELRNLATLDEYREMLETYRRRLFETFDAVNDPMVQGMWMRYQLTGVAR